MNLTDRQRELLELLVAHHESNGGAEFYFACSFGGCGITYAGGISVPGVFEITDLYELQNQLLVNLVPAPGNVQRGKPTQLGITRLHAIFHQRTLGTLTVKPVPPGPTPVGVQLVDFREPESHESGVDFAKANAEAKELESMDARQNGGTPWPPHGQTMMAEYEGPCALLSWLAHARLRQRSAQRENQFGDQIESATKQIREPADESAGVPGANDQKYEEAPLQLKAKSLRQQIVGAAVIVTAETIRDFADALLISQRRLLVHAVLLRRYTGQLVREICRRLTSSEAFATEPSLPWSEDPVAQIAISTCEEIINERRKIEGDGEHSRSEQQEDDPHRTWSSIVVELETLKAPPKDLSGGPELVPESDVRRIVADQIGAKPEDVSGEQIEHAAMELCRHYEWVRVIPSIERPTITEESPYKAAVPYSEFWQKCENEFQKRDTGKNRLLGARWLSLGDNWRFFGGGVGPPSTELVGQFKSLAREAAKGLGSQRGHKSWIDWLNLLRCAKDEDSGKHLYARTSHASSTSNTHVTHGEVPAGGMVEFVLSSDGKAEKRWYLDTETTSIENLFANSANLCLHLRSLVPFPESGPKDMTNGNNAPHGFWKERQGEFSKYSTRFGNLSALWKAAFGRWVLWWGATPAGRHIPQECLDILNAIARKASTKIPLATIKGEVEPWQKWLNFMKERKWGAFYNTGSPIACTEEEWDAGVRDGRPLVQVRDEQQYVFGDEWKKVYERTPDGDLRRLSAEEIAMKSTESLHHHYHWLQDGRIERVFQASADFCEDLAARAFEMELVAGKAGAEQPRIDRSPQPAETGVNRPGSDCRTPEPGRRPSENLPTVADIRTALKRGDRKKAIELRCKLDDCSNKELWMSAFSDRAGKESTKRTAYNRWRESRDDAPSWADELMSARILAMKAS